MRLIESLFYTFEHLKRRLYISILFEPINIEETYNKMTDPNDDSIKKSGLFTSNFFKSNLGLENNPNAPDLRKISKDFQYFNNATAIMTGNH